MLCTGAKEGKIRTPSVQADVYIQQGPRQNIWKAGKCGGIVTRNTSPKELAQRGTVQEKNGQAAWVSRVKKEAGESEFEQREDKEAGQI